MRRSGILLPVSSLPSRWGIGAFDKSAYEFIDRLARANQSVWQILPLGQTGYGDSPYQSFSAYAGNPYFVSLDALIDCFVRMSFKSSTGEAIRSAWIMASCITTDISC